MHRGVISNTEPFSLFGTVLTSSARITDGLIWLSRIVSHSSSPCSLC